MEKLVELLRLHTEKCGLFIDFSGTQKIHGDFHHSRACTLAVAGLEHPQLSVLDCELHVLHILVVVFKTLCNRYELSGAVRHGFFKSRILGATLLF